MDIRQCAGRRGLGSPEVPGCRRSYRFFLAAFFFADFFVTGFFFVTAFFAAFFADFFFVGLFFAAAAFKGFFFFVDVLVVTFFFEVDFFFEADFFFAADLFEVLGLLFFFFVDLPKAADQPSEYFSFVPIRKIVMIFSFRSIQFL